MKYLGRNVDPIAVWEEFVEFPPNMRVDEHTTFLPLVRCPHPDHTTEKRHFQINIKEGLVYCFACKFSGTFEKAIAEIKGCTNREARRTILSHRRAGAGSSGGSASRASVKIKKARDSEITEAAPKLSLDDFTYLPAVGTEYLEKRGITGESVAKWEIGWNPETLRIVVPIRDERRRLVATVDRATKPKDQPKYLYTSGFERKNVLFGACNLDRSMVRSEGLVLVEGSLDAIRLHQHGYANTVAILGSSLSEKQAKLVASFQPSKVFMLFDRDGGGIDAIVSVSSRIKRIPLYVCRYRNGKTDPAELTKQEVAVSISKALTIRKFRKLVPGVFPMMERISFGN
ncbi:MAG: toprim domain-containing protein [Gemmatimonadales bacterium]